MPLNCVISTAHQRTYGLENCTRARGIKSKGCDLQTVCVWMAQANDKSCRRRRRKSAHLLAYILETAAGLSTSKPPPHPPVPILLENYLKERESPPQGAGAADHNWLLMVNFIHGDCCCSMWSCTSHPFLLTLMKILEKKKIHLIPQCIILWLTSAVAAAAWVVVVVVVIAERREHGHDFYK